MITSPDRSNTKNLTSVNSQIPPEREGDFQFAVILCILAVLSVLLICVFAIFVRWRETKDEKDVEKASHQDQKHPKQQQQIRIHQTTRHSLISGPNNITIIKSAEPVDIQHDPSFSSSFKKKKVVVDMNKVNSEITETSISGLKNSWKKTSSQIDLSRQVSNSDLSSSNQSLSTSQLVKPKHIIQISKKLQQDTPIEYTEFPITPMNPHTQIWDEVNKKLEHSQVEEHDQKRGETQKKGKVSHDKQLSKY